MMFVIFTYIAIVIVIIPLGLTAAYYIKMFFQVLAEGHRKGKQERDDYKY